MAAQNSSPHLERVLASVALPLGKLGGSSLPHRSLCCLFHLSPRGPILEGLFFTAMASLTSGLTGSEELLSGCRAREGKLGGHGRSFLKKAKPSTHQLLPPTPAPGSGEVLP